MPIDYKKYIDPVSYERRIKNRDGTWKEKGGFNLLEHNNFDMKKSQYTNHTPSVLLNNTKNRNEHIHSQT